MRARAWVGVAVAFAFGCGDDAVDDGDAGTERDAGSAVVDAGTDAGSTAMDAGPDDAGGEDACVGENAARLCRDADAGCGSLSATDRCGVARTVDCGGCPGAQTCGARGMANRCGYERWDVTTIDDDGDPGHDLSMAIDDADRLWVAYRADAAGLGTLRVAHLDAGGWAIEDVDSGSLVARDTSVAVDPSGGVHVAVPGPVRSGDASYAELWTRGAAGWTMRPTVSGAGGTLDLAFDADGRAQLCVYDPPSSGFGGFLVHLAEQGDGGFAEATIDGSLASTSRAGRWCSIAVDADGTLHTAYYDGQWMRLEHASRPAGGSWREETIVDEPDGDRAGEYAFMVLDPSDRPTIVYRALGITRREIRLATHDGAWSLETIETEAGTIANYPSIAFDSSGTAHVAYYDALGDGMLYYARETASGWRREVLEVVGTGAGGFSAIAVDSADTVHVVFYDRNEARLRHAARVPE